MQIKLLVVRNTVVGRRPVRFTAPVELEDVTLFPQKLSLLANPENAPLASSSNDHTTHRSSTPQKCTRGLCVDTCPMCHEGSGGDSISEWWGGANEESTKNRRAYCKGFDFVPLDVGRFMKITTDRVVHEVFPAAPHLTLRAGLPQPPRSGPSYPSTTPLSAVPASPSTPPVLSRPPSASEYFPSTRGSSGPTIADHGCVQLFGMLGG